MDVGLETILAIWGAGLSTALGGWTIYRDAIANGRLKVSVGVFDVRREDDLQKAIFSMVVRVSVSNPSAQIVAIEALGFSEKRFSKWKSWMPPHTMGLPRALPPGRTTFISLPLSVLTVGGARYLWVWDGLNRPWRCSRRSIRKSLKMITSADFSKVPASPSSELELFLQGANQGEQKRYPLR